MTIKFYYDGIGLTYAYLLEGDALVGSALAQCHPKDQFSKRVGRKLAFTRLVDSLYPGPANKETRRGLWALFLAKVKP